ncbi:MAG: DNA polymerase III subunit beta, partial [Muribaculaceae bacterium]|nr:DNA polymerase III subunit beta [Muribaculaceae bacterium]
MKFNVSGKTFQNQLQAVNKVIGSKNALAILDNFLLKVEGDRLSITGSDQENVMTAYMEIAESECDGEIAVPAKRLLEVIKEISTQPLTFVIDDDTKEVDIRFLNGHFNFMGVDASEYPLSRKPDAEAKTMIIPASIVQKGIDNTLFAVSSDTVRPIMTGIYWDIHESDITFVSSDTHKLVRYINREYAPDFT